MSNILIYFVTFQRLHLFYDSNPVTRKFAAPFAGQRNLKVACIFDPENAKTGVSAAYLAVPTPNPALFSCIEGYFSLEA